MLWKFQITPENGKFSLYRLILVRTNDVYIHPYSLMPHPEHDSKLFQRIWNVVRMISSTAAIGVR